MGKPRSAAAAGKDFPYDLPTTCFIEVSNDGSVSQGADVQAYERAVAGTSRLFAVWPGNYSSDLFVIDDLDAYARAVGIVHDQERTGLAEHEHQIRWQPADRDSNGRGTYIWVVVQFECGCAIRDLRAFADQMRAQRGWEVATSTGWSGSGDRFTVRVRRRSLSA
ncbi:hypothetical protein HCA58_22575 [Micromonospora sp. HNM0581]|uniref:hypothetical protein n=1 Tax=Micromonospora sp. HNM0581 TaxID=2716341 RepID=UPI00146E8255|nr:hypothetical protein [Micromonospora sp. HNM0581]NLU81079.1 hypothetical protein [Micromonospora sp. HNM0581]